MRLRTFRTLLVASLWRLPARYITRRFNEGPGLVLEEIRLGGVCTLQAGSLEKDWRPSQRNSPSRSEGENP